MRGAVRTSPNLRGDLDGYHGLEHPEPGGLLVGFRPRRYPLAMRKCLASGLVALAACHPLLAQRDLAADLDRAVADLSSPAHQWDAARQLARAGAGSVPRIEPILTSHRERPTSTIQAALLVAGQIHRDALPLLPALLDVYRYSRESAVQRQALWAAGEIAPFAEAESRAEAMQFLVHHFTVGGDLFLFECVRERIRLGHAVTEAAVVECLTSSASSARLIAVCDAFTTRPAEPPHSMEGPLVQLVSDHLARRLERPLHPWDVDTRFECEVGSLAKVAWVRSCRTPLVARALLQHWDPELRLAALLPLQSPTALTTEERWDVVARLWDAFPEVRTHALATTSGWGDGFAIAVPALLACERSWPRAEVAAGQRARDRWMEGASPLRSAAIQILRGDEVPSARMAATDRDRTMFAQLVMGCRGLSGARIESLATFAREQKIVTKPLVNAFLWCVAATDEAQCEAMRALVALGPSAAKVEPGIATELLRRQAMGLRPSDRSSAITEAWMRAGPAASTTELEDALECDHWCVVARALVEVLHRDAISDRAKTAAAVVRTRTYADVVVQQGDEWSGRRGNGFQKSTLAVDHESLSALATLLLLAADDPRWRDEQELRWLLPYLGEDATVDALLGARARGELPALARQIEVTRRPSWMDTPNEQAEKR